MGKRKPSSKSGSKPTQPPPVKNIRISETVNTIVSDFPKRLLHLIEQTCGSRGKRPFAERTGIKEGTLHDYLNGKSVPNIESAAKIARVSGCDLRWLITGEGDAFPPVSPTSADGHDRLRKLQTSMVAIIEQLALAVDAIAPLLPPDAQGDVLSRLEQLAPAFRASMIPEPNAEYAAAKPEPRTEKSAKRPRKRQSPR